MRQTVVRCALALAAAAFACPHVAASSVRVDVVGPDSAPVEDAVVFLRPLSDQKPSAHSPLPAAIEQHDREFVPYLTVVQTGATVRFPNQDSIRHHVYSFSQPKKFEIKLYAGDGPAIVFDKPGVVTLGCNVHDWMLGYVFVVDTPWFAKTGRDGSARIEDVGDGDYEVHIWHPRQRHEVAQQPLRVSGASPGPLRFVIEATPRKPHYKPPLNPLQY